MPKVVGTSTKDDTVVVLDDNDNSSKVMQGHESSGTTVISNSLTSWKQRKTEMPKKRKLDRLSQYIDSVSPKEQEQINILLSKLFFACNIPFEVVESNHFINFVKSLRPSYTIPKLEDLCTVMLNDLHEKIDKYTSSTTLEGVLIIKKVEKEATSQVIAFVKKQDKSVVYLSTKEISRRRTPREPLTETLSATISW